jgi:hypothetical protein
MIAPPPLNMPATLVASSNAALLEIQKLVASYNALYPLRRDQKLLLASFIPDPTLIETLDAIATQACIYLLHKPPGARKASGVAKWHACRGLLADVARHGEFFGVKFLLADFEPDGMNYWLERLHPDDARHTDFDDLISWLDTTTKKAFEGAGKRVGDKALLYLNDAQRMKHEVHFSDGKFEWSDDTPVSTENSAVPAAYSGFRSVYIYVCSAKDQKIYSMQGEEGHTHHSSFLRGEPVISAGDWLVYEGQALYINGASGHYRPGPENLRLFATVKSMCWTDRTVIQPEYMGHVYRMQEYLRDGANAKPLADDALGSVAVTLGTTPQHLTRHAK